MVEKTESTSVAKAFGRKLVDENGNDVTVPFSFKFKIFDSLADAKANGASYEEKDILQMLNAKEKAKERASSQSTALENAGYELPKDDEQKNLRDLIGTLEASGKHKGKEREVAERILDVKYAENLTLAPKPKAVATA